MINKVPPPYRPLVQQASTPPPAAPSSGGAPIEIACINNGPSQHTLVIREQPNTSNATAQAAFSARLHDAIAAGDYAGVQLLTGAGFDLDQCHGHNDPPLIVALRSGHEEASGIAQLLVASGANPGVASRIDGVTPLMLAIARLEVGTVASMLEYQGIEIHRPDNNGMTAYRLAEQGIEHSFGEAIFRLMVSHDRLHGGSEVQTTPVARLCRAVVTGDLKSVKSLAHASIDPDACDGLNDPALLIAASSKHANAGGILELLLGVGASPNLANRKTGETSLIMAIRDQSLGKVSHLLDDPRTDIHRVDHSGKTAYMHAQDAAHKGLGGSIFKMIEAHLAAHPKVSKQR